MLDGAAPGKFTPAQCETVTAIVDTFVPSVRVRDDPDGFFGRAGSAVGADQAVLEFLADTVPDTALAGLTSLLDELSGLAQQPVYRRETVLRSVAATGPAGAAAVATLRQLSFLFAYGGVDGEGRNLFWTAIGYPGPVSAPPPVPKTLVVASPSEDVFADVVVVGSGSGGGVVAAELAAAGRKVVVLEAGGYFNEADFPQLELWAYQNLFLRGGFFTTADGNVTMAAGCSVGGGSTVNWSNCVRTPDEIHRLWAGDHGLSGVDGREFDEHLNAVAARLGISSKAAVLNRPHERLFAGAEKLGYHHRRAELNVDPKLLDLTRIGYSGFGDQTGAKQGTLKTYLQDASDFGATIFPRTRADRVLLSGGRAVGVQAGHSDPERGRREVRVHAPQIVLAAGALETPRLLLRSGIGGPAAGKYLRIHPVGLVSGQYAEPTLPWTGPAQAGIVDEFSRREQGHGFLLECSHHYLGLLSTGIPWCSGVQDKELVLHTRHRADFVCLVQDRGSGSVTLDAQDEAVYHYPFEDELDLRNFRDALGTAARVHEAASAERIFASGQGIPPWRRGEDLEEFLTRLRRCPIGLAGLTVFTAHPMGSARMGTDPATSVAGALGELHETPGLWVGDTSAFPTAAGVNPMWTCMALARRTAHNLLAATGG